MCSEYGHSEDDDEDMGSEDVEQIDEVSQALAVADALGKSSKSKSSGTKLDDIADGLKELDMDRYDDEDEGIFIAQVLGFHCFLQFIDFF